VPMGSLVDREDQKFLIQKYAIATTPSLTLTNPQPIDREKLRALALGLTQSATVDGQPFPALENVSIEIQGVAAELPGSKPLFDQEFTRSRLEQELTDNAYSVIHVATHGQFGTEPEDTFLITGDAGQANKLTLNVLDSILRSASLNTTLELLSLTACQTAVGDDRAALGLAGVAAQAGAKSVLASLWFIDDAATAQLITDFYSNLRTGSSKAQALQAAQRSLIENGIDGDRTYSHPAYWASFVLIGNWL
jgi:CHAT domain-containing protein